MGYDIEAIRQAKRVARRHSDEVCEDENHVLIGLDRKRLDGREHRMHDVLERVVRKRKRKLTGFDLR